MSNSLNPILSSKNGDLNLYDQNYDKKSTKIIIDTTTMSVKEVDTEEESYKQLDDGVFKRPRPRKPHNLVTASNTNMLNISKTYDNVQDVSMECQNSSHSEKSDSEKWSEEKENDEDMDDLYSNHTTGTSEDCISWEEGRSDNPYSNVQDNERSRESLLALRRKTMYLTKAPMKPLLHCEDDLSDSEEDEDGFLVTLKNYYIQKRGNDLSLSIYEAKL